MVSLILRTCPLSHNPPCRAPTPDLSISSNLPCLPTMDGGWGHRVSKHSQPLWRGHLVLLAETVRVMTTEWQHSLADQPQPPPPQLPPLSPNPLYASELLYKVFRQEGPRGHQRLGRSQLGKARPRPREAGLDPLPHPAPSKGNLVCSREVNGDLCSCLVRTRILRLCLGLI